MVWNVKMNRTTKRQKYKPQKGITSAKKNNLLMLWKNGLIPKQHHVFFDSPTMAMSVGKKDDIDSNSDSDNEEDQKLHH